jgi:hypothetical protein
LKIQITLILIFEIKKEKKKPGIGGSMKIHITAKLRGVFFFSLKPFLLPKRKAEKKKRKKRKRENHRVPNGGCMTKPLLVVAALLSWQGASGVGAQILVAFVLAIVQEFRHVGR